MTVPPDPEPVLSLSEWIVLSLVCEGVTHGNAVTQHLARYGDLGYVWNVQKAVVYRSLDRLSDLGLVRPAGEEYSPKGPTRQLVKATDAGRTAAVAWQQQPVQHTRDIRSELPATNWTTSPRSNWTLLEIRFVPSVDRDGSVCRSRRGLRDTKGPSSCGGSTCT